MFTVKTPHTVPPGRSKPDAMIDKAEFATLEEAIHATLKADLDLNSTVIEVRGIMGPVNDWISVRVAGGDVWLG